MQEWPGSASAPPVASLNVSCSLDSAATAPGPRRPCQSQVGGVAGSMLCHAPTRAHHQSPIRIAHLQQLSALLTRMLGPSRQV